MGLNLLLNRYHVQAIVSLNASTVALMEKDPQSATYYVGYVDGYIGNQARYYERSTVYLMGYSDGQGDRDTQQPG